MSKTTSWGNVEMVVAEGILVFKLVLMLMA
jgi:hypothetical protein